MDALVLVCGPAAVSDRTTDLSGHTGVRFRDVSRAPGRTEIDPLLANAEPRRVVVVGTDSDLAAVVVRLLRTRRLANVAVGYVPLDVAHSPVAALWGLPAELPLARILDSEPERVPLIRDDAGGVLMGLGEFNGVHGEAYCDDAVALRGDATRIEVSPDLSGGAGLTATVRRRTLLRTRTDLFRGRAFQLGCHPTIATVDGISHASSVRRWTWYRHTEDLLVSRS